MTPDITPEAVDALIERLREWWEYDTGHLMVRSGETLRALAARLAEVEAERDDLSELLDKANECAGRNFARAEAAEAKLAKALDAFKKLDRRGDSLETFDNVVHEIVTTALAELKGEKHE
jgi:ABC-type transporter Mla subunit MlaD